MYEARLCVSRQGPRPVDDEAEAESSTQRSRVMDPVDRDKRQSRRKRRIADDQVCAQIFRRSLRSIQSRAPCVFAITQVPKERERARERARARGEGRRREQEREREGEREGK